MYQQLVRAKDNLAHAYLLEGDAQMVTQELQKFIISDLGYTYEANPNIFHKVYERITIDDAREIDALQSKTSLGTKGSRNIFIIEFGDITGEAQNALLKCIEEPSEQTLMFFITSDHLILLPTVRSRVQLLSQDTQEASVYHEEVQDFLCADYDKRMKQVGKFLGDSKKNKSPQRSTAALFISELASEWLQKNIETREGREVYKELRTLQDYARDRSSSLKYIFEYISIRVPVDKIES